MEAARLSPDLLGRLKIRRRIPRTNDVNVYSFGVSQCKPSRKFSDEATNARTCGM